jgi:glucose-6-phosphate 1-dehydrogenase
VIFGASGDLTSRLLLPALYNLAATGLLPERFAIIGVARSVHTADEFRQDLLDALQAHATREVDPQLAQRLVAHVAYVSGSIDDPETFSKLKATLEEIEADAGTQGNRLFYLAMPPDTFEPIARQLARAGLSQEGASGAPWRRVVVEKPFGTDLASARALNRALLEVLTEDQIYRIDHYLGKETVQNILLLRFANGLFEPIWNRNHIDHVQITVAETVTVERRGRFYDRTGALRDMVPNHLFQLLALIAMEPPTRFEAERVRNAKAEALAAIRIPSEADAFANSVRGQYRAGRVHDEPVVAYRDAEHVPPGSITETYAALRLEVDNWRWAGVPFYLRTGKALSVRRTEVAIKFKQAPISMFEQTSVDRLGQNFLVLRIQPNEGITLRFNAKVPGPVLAAESVDMTFKYKDHFDVAPSTGYETLIYDCMTGDALHFQRADGVEAGWAVVQPFLDAWAKAGTKGLEFYPAGSSGPEEAGFLLARDGRRWRTIE